MKKYIVHPGPVRSEKDGDIHFISHRQLMRLYNVDPSECVIISWRDPVPNLIRRQHPGAIDLYPDPSGMYALPLPEVTE